MLLVRWILLASYAGAVLRSRFALRISADEGTMTRYADHRMPDEWT